MDSPEQQLPDQPLNEDEQEQFVHTLNEEAEAADNDPAAADRIILMLKERLWAGDAATLARLQQQIAAGAALSWLKIALWQCATLAGSPAAASSPPLISELFAIPLIIETDTAPALPERLTDRDLAIFLSQSFRDEAPLCAQTTDRVLVMPRFFTLGQLHAWNPVTAHDLLHELLTPEDGGTGTLLSRLFFASSRELPTDHQFDLPPHARFMASAPLALRFLIGVHTHAPEDAALWSRRGQTAAMAQWQDRYAQALEAHCGGLFTTLAPLPFYPALQAGWTAFNLARVARCCQADLSRRSLPPGDIHAIISWHGPADETGKAAEATELHIGFIQPGPPTDLIGGALWPLTELDEAAQVVRQLVREQQAHGLSGCDVLPDLLPIMNGGNRLIYPLETGGFRAFAPPAIGPATR